MMKRGGRNDQIGLRKCVTSLASHVDHDAPLQHGIFRHAQDACPEHRVHLVTEPLIQCNPLRRIGQYLDSTTYLRQRYSTDIETIEGFGR